MVSAFRVPTTLSVADYTPLPIVVDPHDGTPQDAVTAFKFEMFPDPPPERFNGRFRVARAAAIMITPIAVIRTGVVMSPDLLAHEQLHYDVGFVIARQLARELNIIDAPTDPDLRVKVAALFALHFTTRNNLIQSRYDRETNHSQNRNLQRIWSSNMRTCLANAHAHQIGGWML